MRVAGSILLLLGLSGLAFLPKFNVVEGFFHLFVGAIYVYGGFLNRDASVVPSMV